MPAARSRPSASLRRLSFESAPSGQRAEANKTISVADIVICVQKGQLAPLTDREQRVWNLLRRAVVAEILFLLAAAVQGVLARGLVQAYCRSAPAGPAYDTAGYRYCQTVSPAYTWLLFALAGVVIAQVFLRAAHRRKHRRGIALLAVLVMLIANTLVVFSLAGTGP
jgi:hypothetical protein